jgi:hypothetical protein
MPLQTHKYTNGEVAIVWKPARCIHSGYASGAYLKCLTPAANPGLKLVAAVPKKLSHR